MAEDEPFVWSRANSDDLHALHGIYRYQCDEPFFLEISGPNPGMTHEEFIVWCENDARMWVARHNGAIAGFMWFSYIQSEIGVANADWRIFIGEPAPASAAAESLRSCFAAVWCELRLRKAYLFCLARQRRRIALARSFGFIPEGVLSEHFFDRRRLRDLLCFGRLEMAG